MSRTTHTTENQKPLILIVDDAPKNLQVLVNILRKEDYKVAVTTSGHHALELINEHKPDLILLDIIMPDLDGYEVCRILKDSSENRDIPIIFLTGKTETEDIVKGFKLGAVDYVTKPFDSTELLSRVETHLEVKKGKDMVLQMNRKLKVEIEERKKIEEELKKKNAILDKMAITDGLTGLYNHRYVIERLGLEISSAKRYGYKISVIMLDLDRFKQVNDTFGHQVGDVVLAKTAYTIKEQLREVDIIGRYGGEEFLVIFPHTDLAGASIIGERIRHSIEMLAWEDENLKVTISGGIAELKGENASELITKADNYLYTAKQKGRNKINY